MNLADEGQQRNVLTMSIDYPGYSRVKVPIHKPARTQRLKDFLLLYNKLTEQCFQRCVVTLNRVSLSKYESDCIGVCTDRYVTYNQKLMFKFMEHQNLRQQAAVREAQTAPEPPATGSSARG